MRILRGHGTDDLPDAELRARAVAAARVVVDVGTGDGRGAYRLAAEQPTWLVIGLDPAAERMAATAAKAARKPPKGGRPNLLLVVARAEDAPPALDGVAHEVRVQLPWSGLLRGVVRGDAPVVAGLRRMARDDALLTVVIGTDIWREPVPAEIRDLPRLSPADLEGPVAERYRALGFRITTIAEAEAPAPESPATSWERRLRAGRAGAGFLTLRAVAIAPEPPDRATGAVEPPE